MSTSSPDPLVQYVVVRGDLKWPAGSVMAQAVHAGVAAVWQARQKDSTRAYCDEADGGQMRTVVLKADTEDAVKACALKLAEQDVDHVVWKEQPEDFVTALAAAPYPSSVIKPHFKKFKLFK